MHVHADSSRTMPMIKSVIILIKNELATHKVVLLCFQSTHNGVELLIICRASLSFSLKNITSHFSCDNTALIPTPLASQSTLKSFSKSGKARTSAVHNFSFKTTKVISASSPQWNSLFFKHLVIGAAIVLKCLISAYRMSSTRGNSSLLSLFLG